MVALGVPNLAEELGGIEVVGVEKLAVAAAAIHQVGGHFTAELGLGLGDQAGQPDDAFDQGLLGREFGHVDGVGGWFAVLFLEKIVAADDGDAESRGQGGLAAPGEVFDEIEKLLFRVADRLEEGLSSGIDQAVGFLMALVVFFNGFVEEGREFGFPSGVGLAHGIELAYELVCATGKGVWRGWGRGHFN